MAGSAHTKKARIVLLGAGRMGKLRAPILYANPSISLVAVADIMVEAGSALAGKYEAAFLDATDLEAALRSVDVDALWISTPTFTHTAAVEAAVRSGRVKSIFTEKPVDEGLAGISHLFGLCNTAGVSLCCGFQRRFDPSYVAVKESVRSGRVGTPGMVRVMFADHPAPPMEFLLKGGCPFMDLSPHDMDYVRWVLDDEPTEVYGTGTSSTDELKDAGVFDNATMLVKFSRGAVCTLMMSRGATYGYDQRCEVFGDGGLAQVANEQATTQVLSDRDGVHRDRLKHSFPQRFRAAFENECGAFADHINNGTAWPITMRDCLAAQAMAQAAAKSAEEGRIVQISELEGARFLSGQKQTPPAKL